MLRTAFIGQQNYFDQAICEWLSEHTELSLIIWTNKLSWSHGHGWERVKNVFKRFSRRVRKKGWLRSTDEFLYYLLYRKFLQTKEVKRLRQAVEAVRCRPRKPLAEIPQTRASDINSPELLAQIRSAKLDAIFAMCIDVYLPAEILSEPRLGAFLWHEGITPEYRGVYSPFWALLRGDFRRIGYTLLRMNSKYDAGEIYVQGNVENVDFWRDWHSYIGHKAVLDSLPQVQQFLVALERNEARPIDRPEAVDGYFSYPTATGLLRLMARRFWKRLSNQMPSRSLVR